jgi:hypothetical protein
MDSHEVGVLPLRTKSKRTRSSNPSRDPNRGDYATKPSSTISNSTPRAARSNPTSRTSSAPLLPAIKIKNSNLLSGEDDVDADLYSIRDSVASIKDDPFFRNYQSPNSVSLTRELRTATNSERLRDGRPPNEPPPRSPKRASVDNSVNLPVSPPPTLNPKCTRTEFLYTAPVKKRNVRHQYCSHWKCWCWKEHTYTTGPRPTIPSNIYSLKFSHVSGQCRLYS